MNEIDQIRTDLEAKLNELAVRLPPMARWGKRALGGVGGGVVLFALTRMRLRMKAPARQKRASKRTGAAAAPTSVLVRGGISAPAALGVAAVWAAVRVYEAHQRAQATQSRGPAIVRDFPTERRAP